MGVWAEVGLVALVQLLGCAFIWGTLVQGQREHQRRLGEHDEKFEKCDERFERQGNQISDVSLDLANFKGNLRRKGV
jgi:hypothetical protein